MFFAIFSRQPRKIRCRYHHCSDCKLRSFPVDVTLGLPKRYSTDLQRRVARCVGQTSYEIVRGNLAELCQIYLSAVTIGKIAEETAREIAERLKNNPDVCLDIYHGAEQKEWFERMRNVLLPGGLSGMERELSLLKADLKESHVKSMDSLLEYCRGNSGRLDYCGRLLAGRVIGSGLVEGACKNLVGRRLKQTGAPWRLSQANRMASICSVLLLRPVETVLVKILPNFYIPFNDSMTDRRNDC